VIESVFQAAPLDNLTHSLTGLALSRAGLNRLTPRGTAVLIVASNIPDIDVLTSAWGPLAYLNYHRHLTHSLFMAPLMALLPPLLVRLAAGKGIRWRMAYLLSLAGLASHLALDFTNVYGVRLLLPFSGRWLRLDITSVVDPWIWCVLLLALIAPAGRRVVGSETGATGRHPGRMAARLALVFLLVYDCARAVIHERALSILDSRIYTASPPRRLAAFPMAFNPFAWQGLVEGDSSYQLFNINVRKPFDPANGRMFYTPEDSEAIRSARQTKTFQDFLAFSQFPVWTITPVSEPSNGLRIQLSDLRFGVPPNGGFTATAIVDGEKRVLRSWFEFL
jgi:inner membrane protein